MRALFVAVLALMTLVPTAQACVLEQKDLCKIATDAGFEGAFGDYADVVFVVLALLALIVLLNLIALLFRKSPKPKYTIVPREQVKEVSPGGVVQLILDVENQRPKTSLDLAVDVENLPAGWSAAPFAAVGYPSGFTAPVAISAESPLHLSSANRGAHKAAVAVQLTAPTQVAVEETLDVPVRVVPMSAGVRKPAQGEDLHFSVALTTKRALLAVKNVTHDPEHIVAGRPVATKAHIANTGEVEAREVGVNFLLNDQNVDHQVVAILPPGGDATVEFHWTPAHGENRIRINVA